MVEYTYTAYGKSTVLVNSSLSEDEMIIANNIIDNNIFRYKGYCYDTEVELYWLTTRYYSPELCRFISPNSVEYLVQESVNGINLYCYCLNNPVSYVDPSGHSALLTIALIGIICSGLINGISNVFSISSEENVWGAFAGGFFEGIVTSASLAAGLTICIMSGGVGYMLLGGLIAFTGGFIGGKYGNALSQYISFGNVDWNIANINGILSGTVNIMLYTIFYANKSILSNSNKFVIGFLENIQPSVVSLGISVLISSAPRPNINEYRNNEKIKTQEVRFIWEYLIK